MSATPLVDRHIIGSSDPWIHAETARGIEIQLREEIALQKRHTEVINGTLRATLGMEDGRDCWDEIQRLKEGAARYEYLRKLNPREFAALTLFCNTSGIHFDAEVDRRRSTK